MKTIIKNVPKVELHLHLDGSVRVETVAELLQMDRDAVSSNMVCDSYTNSLTDYLSKFELPLKVMQTTEHLKRIMRELLEDLKQEHVIYVEVRFAPQLHMEKGLTMNEVVQAVLDGTKEVTGIDCNLILCCMRQVGNHGKNLETIEVAKKFSNQGVVAIDLAGDESKYPTDQFGELFDKVKQVGIPYIIHAGEAADYHSIDSAIQLGATRIGHGIAAIQNKEVIRKLKHQNILLEVCPESNLNTKIVLDKKDHPLKQLYSEVFVSINTDNRTVSDITLTQEYEDAIQLFGFTLGDIKQCNLNAIAHAFISEEKKEQLCHVIEEGFYDATH